MLLSVWALTGAVGNAAEPVTIGLTLSQTGKYAELGEMQKLGYQLWERHVNEAGGLLGRPVAMRIQDDRSDPHRAARLYESMIVEEGVDLVLGPYSSSITMAVVPVAERHGYPLLAGGASADAIWSKGYQYVFGVYSPASRYAVEFLELAVVNGMDSLAVVAADDAFSRSAAAGVMTWSRRFELDLLLNRFFPKGEASYRELAAECKAVTPDLLIVCGHFEESVGFRQALHELGWHPRAFYATVGPATEDYATVLGELASLTFTSSQYEPRANISFESFTRFNADFQSLYGFQPAYQAAAAYAAGELLSAAVSRVGSLDREALRQTLLNMDATTLIGRYGVDRTGMQVKHWPLIVQWQKGRKEIVWPTEVRTAEPVFLNPQAAP